MHCAELRLLGPHHAELKLAILSTVLLELIKDRVLLGRRTLGILAPITLLPTALTRLSRNEHPLAFFRLSSCLWH